MLFKRKSIVMVIKIGSSNHEDVKLTSGQLKHKDDKTANGFEKVND